MIRTFDVEPDLYLSREERDRLMQEYQRSFTHYVGAIPTFESWVKEKKKINE